MSSSWNINLIIGKGRSEEIEGSSANDLILAKKGDDVVYGGDGDDTIFGGQGNDIIFGQGGNDWIFGGRGQDMLYGGTGSDTISAGTGDDTVVHNLSENIGECDYANGGWGYDKLIIEVTAEQFDEIDAAGVQAAYEAARSWKLFHFGQFNLSFDFDLYVRRFEELIFEVAPDAMDDAASVFEDDPMNMLTGDVNVLDNDTDDNSGDTKEVTAVDGDAANVGMDIIGTYGTLNLASDGTYTYTVDNANLAVDALDDADMMPLMETFTYQVTDSWGLSDTATLTITINGANDAPVAEDDMAQTKEDEAFILVDVLANDTDVDGDDNHTNFTLLSIDAVNGDLPPTWITIDNNQIRIEPAGNLDHIQEGGSETFDIEYTMSDDSGATSSAVLTVVVDGVNDAPVAYADLFVADEAKFEIGNAALFGIASQSTTYSSGTAGVAEASRANDGNIDGVYINGSVSSTKLDAPDPWWQVNLGSLQTIEEIVIFNRNDGPFFDGRLDNFTVSIWNGDPDQGGTNVFSHNYLLSDLFLSPVDGQGILKIDPSITDKGDFVRVQLVNDGVGVPHLHMAEVQVFTAEALISPSYTFGNVLNGTGNGADEVGPSEDMPVADIDVDGPVQNLSAVDQVNWRFDDGSGGDTNTMNGYTITSTGQITQDSDPNPTDIVEMELTSAGTVQIHNLSSNPNFFDDLDTGEDLIIKFDYQATDGALLSTTATSIVTIAGETDNRPPVASSANLNIPDTPNITSQKSLLDYVTDPDGDTLMFTDLNLTSVAIGGISGPGAGSGPDEAIFDIQTVTTGYLASFTVTAINSYANGGVNEVATIDFSSTGLVNIDSNDAFDALPVGAFLALIFDYTVEDPAGASGSNSVTLRIDGADNMDVIFGSANGDLLEGGLEDDTVRGFEGNDLITGGPGDDTLDGGADVDTAVYSADILAAPLRNFVNGVVDVNQVVTVMVAGVGLNYNLSLGAINFTSGIIVDDTSFANVDGRDLIVADVVTLGDNTSSSVEVIDFDSFGYNLYNSISGVNESDTISALAGSNALMVGGDNDQSDFNSITIIGNAGNDILLGGDSLGTLPVGDYFLNGFAGNDILVGGDNYGDHFHFLDGAVGADILKGGDLFGEGYDLRGGNDDDILIAGDNLGIGSYLLNGERGDDTLIAGDGDHKLYGDANFNANPAFVAGNDFLEGGAGDDLLYGDTDLEFGGNVPAVTGADTFFFDLSADIGMDQILDFDLAGSVSTGKDVLEFEGVGGSLGIVDLDALLSSVTDEGLGGDVVFEFSFGTNNSITVAGVGTGSITSFADFDAEYAGSVSIVS